MTSPATGPRPATTAAAVWFGGDRVELTELPVPDLGPGEVLVRVDLATVCGSDLHTVSGRRSGAHPSVLGHEAVGRVVAIGPEPPRTVDGRVVVAGTRLVWGVTAACGHCDRCTRGMSAKCRHVRKTGHEALSGGWPLSGGYARHVHLIAGLALVEVPDEIPDAVAAPAACATATVMAALEATGNVTDRRVLVIGAGMLGLTAVAAARRAGAASVAVVDPDAARRATAQRFGAEPDTADPAGVDVVAVDVVWEFSGNTEATTSALARLDVGGVAVLVGAVAPTSPVALDPEWMVRGWRTVTGVHNYEPRHLLAAIDLLRATGELPWADLVAPARPLAGVADLLTGHGPRPPRTAVRP